MKCLRLAFILAATASIPSLAFAQSQAPTQMSSCKAQASGKKLAGAALNSFMTKCERDSQAACDLSANQKKLAGAAKASFTKKCISDAVGN